jgi:predicted esterase
MAVARHEAHAVRFYVAVALGVAAAATAIVLGGRSRSDAASIPAQPIGDAGVVEWCAPALTPIAGGGCFAAPTSAARPAEPVPLVVYLHGRYSPATVAEEHARQARVATLATKRGFAVLALRGKQGQCTDPSLSDFWCWPSNEKNAADGAAFVVSWAPAIADAERRLGAHGRRVLLGFSSGAYFATLIATRALHPFDAIAIAHGGPVAPTAAAGAKIPLLLETADDDPSNEEMIRLSDELKKIEWPHHVFAREGGHELPETDVEMALTFFTRTKTEKLPLQPPLSTRAPRRAPPDAGDVDAAPAIEEHEPSADDD